MDHSTEVFLQIEAIFNEAVEAPAEVRAALIAELCGGDESLIAEVESLLLASESVEQLTSGRVRPTGETGEVLPEKRRIGPYELGRLLGRGGMGAVYLAHRADGQFEQQVAIKLIDLPLATDLFRERFRQERQILAGLQHPYIARLLDGGVTGDGDLYLAMEYVDGTPIHRFCEQHQLSVARRLALFKRVCEAVQFAHQNLVVHRDLKPDNILVAEDGTPRLLDFGTAKLVSPSLENQEGDLTRQGFQSYTPQYASPEQVLGNPISTASDTYSLGVLLYLLLTGTLPYTLRELSTTELMRVICIEPPRKPATEVGSTRHLDADLEAILMKALRKEPLERYLTVEQLVTDIQDYLSGRPVTARRGTLRYRAAKFIRRNRLGIGAAALLAATLAAGVAGVLWQARVANQQRRMADARSADLRQLSNSLLSELDEAIQQLPGSTGVQKLLVTRVLEHLDRMAKDAQGDRLTQIDLVDAYTRLGNIQGNPYYQNLGDPAGALASMAKALSIAEPLAAAAPKDHDTLMALATAHTARSEILFGAGRTQDAIPSMQAAVATYEQLIANPNASAPLICETAAVYGSLGDELGQSGTASLANSSAALAAYRKALELDARAHRVDPDFLRARRGLALMLMKIGSVEMETDPVQANQDFRIALERADALPSADQSGLSATRMRAMLLRKEANSLTELGQFSEARPLFEKAVQIHEQFAKADPQDVRALADLEVILDDEAVSFEEAAEAASSRTSDAAERRRNRIAAEALLVRGEGALETMLKQDPHNDGWREVLASAQVRIGTIRAQEHLPGDSEALAKKGIATLKELSAKPQASVMILDQTVRALLDVEPVSLREPRFAVACAERAAELSHRKTASLLLSLAQAYHASGQIERARATAAEGLALLAPQASGAPKPRIRRLLEVEAQAAPPVKS